MKKKVFEIREESPKRPFIRIIGIGAIIFCAVNFNNNQEVYAISMILIAFYLLIMDQPYKIVADDRGIHIIQSNLINFMPIKEFIRYQDIDGIDFKPSKFSLTMFLLNGIIRTRNSSIEKSELTFFLKREEPKIVYGVGDEEEIKLLQDFIAKHQERMN